MSGSALRRLASLRNATRRTVPLRCALLRIATQRNVFVSLASPRSAAQRTIPPRAASYRSAPQRDATQRNVSLKGREINMLQRPEILTREHVLLWLSSKPTTETYDWMADDCPCATYTKEHGLAPWSKCPELINDTPNMPSLQTLARNEPWTWGSLHARARTAWQM
jgi:hypothetical protein